MTLPAAQELVRIAAPEVLVADIDGRELALSVDGFLPFSAPASQADSSIEVVDEYVDQRYLTTIVKHGVTIAQLRGHKLLAQVVGDTLWIVITHHPDSSLWRVSLVDGRADEVEHWPARLPCVELAGPWLAHRVSDPPQVRILRDGVLQQTIRPPKNHTLGRFAISGSGAFAWILFVNDDEDRILLEVIRGDARASVELPAAVALRWA